MTLLGFAEPPETAQGQAPRVAGEHEHVEMLLVFGSGLGAGMPLAGLARLALERVQAAELRHPDDPGRVVFGGQDGQHLLQRGDGVVVAAAQYRQVGEVPQSGTPGQGMAGLPEAVRGNAQQELRIAEHLAEFPGDQLSAAYKPG